MRKSSEISSSYDIVKMMTSVHHWLNYMQQVSRIDLVAESSIVYPTMEYLERNTNAENCYMERAYDEFSDSEFKNKKYVDLMWSGKKNVFLMEFKYVGASTKELKERQRYFNDIVRLSIALKTIKTLEKKIEDCDAEVKETKCYFLVCGKGDLYEEQILNRQRKMEFDYMNKGRGRRPKINSEFNQWIALDNVKNDIYRTIDYNDIEQKDYFCRFIAEYFEGDKNKKIKEEEKEALMSMYKDKFLPKFYTKRIGILKDVDSGGQVLGIWEILLTKNEDTK